MTCKDLPDVSVHVRAATILRSSLHTLPAVSEAIAYIPKWACSRRPMPASDGGSGNEVAVLAHGDEAVVADRSRS